MAEQRTAYDYRIPHRSPDELAFLPDVEVAPHATG